MSISNPVTGASEVSVNESSVVLDPAVRTIGLSHISHEMNAVPQAGESRHIASSEYGWSIIVWTWTFRWENKLIFLMVFYENKKKKINVWHLNNLWILNNFHTNMQMFGVRKILISFLKQSLFSPRMHLFD